MPRTGPRAVRPRDVTRDASDWRLYSPPHQKLVHGQASAVTSAGDQTPAPPYSVSIACAILCATHVAIRSVSITTKLPLLGDRFAQSWRIRNNSF